MVVSRTKVRATPLLPPPLQLTLWHRGKSRCNQTFIRAVPLQGFEQLEPLVDWSCRYRALQQTIQQAANRPSEAALTARELSPSHTRRLPTTALLEQPNSAREATANPPSTGRRAFGLQIALSVVYRAAHTKGSIMLVLSLASSLYLIALMCCAALWLLL